MLVPRSAWRHVGAWPARSQRRTVLRPEAERPGDRLQRQTLPAQARDLGEAGIAAVLRRPRPPLGGPHRPLGFGRNARFRDGGLIRHQWLGGGPRRGAQIAVVLVEDRAQGVAAVAQQMQSVRHLDGVRGAPGGSLGIGAGAVADHGGHAGMRPPATPPACRRCGRAAGRPRAGAPGRPGWCRSAGPCATPSRPRPARSPRDRARRRRCARASAASCG